MKKLATIACFALLSACVEEKPESIKITELEAAKSISGGSSKGHMTFNLFGGSGYYSSYLSSDIARVPYRLSINSVVFSNNAVRERYTKEYMLDVYLQRSEILDIMSRKNLSRFAVVQLDDLESRESCYYLKYGTRKVEVITPGNTTFGCHLLVSR